MPPAIRVSELERAYGERPVLVGLSFEVPEGATLAVLGANGAGKTTLMRILATLLRPHAGTVEVLGEAVPQRGWAVRGRLGFLAHDPLLYRDLTAYENLEYHRRLHGAPAHRTEAVLEAVGLMNRCDEPLRTLSRGMVQRAAIARTVLHEPELLLLDEPFSGLDPQARAQVEPLLGRASGRTRVLISHDLDEGLAEADVVLGLRGGGAAVFAPAGDLTRDELRTLYA